MGSYAPASVPLLSFPDLWADVQTKPHSFSSVFGSPDEAAGLSLLKSLDTLRSQTAGKNSGAAGPVESLGEARLTR